MTRQGTEIILKAALIDYLAIWGAAQQAVNTTHTTCYSLMKFISRSLATSRRCRATSSSVSSCVSGHLTSSKLPLLLALLWVPSAFCLLVRVRAVCFSALWWKEETRWMRVLRKDQSGGVRGSEELSDKFITTSHPFHITHYNYYWKIYWLVQL